MNSMMLEMQMSGVKPEMTGSLVFRDAAVSINAPKGMKVMLVLGVVIVPENFQVAAESQVRVLGYADKSAVTVFLEPKGKPIPEKYAGWTANDFIVDYSWKA